MFKIRKNYKTMTANDDLTKEVDQQINLLQNKLK